MASEKKTESEKDEKAKCEIESPRKKFVERPKMMLKIKTRKLHRKIMTQKPNTKIIQNYKTVSCFVSTCDLFRHVFRLKHNDVKFRTELNRDMDTGAFKLQHLSPSYKLKTASRRKGEFKGSKVNIPKGRRNQYVWPLEYHVVEYLSQRELRFEFQNLARSMKDCTVEATRIDKDIYVGFKNCVFILVRTN